MLFLLNHSEAMELTTMKQKLYIVDCSSSVSVRRGRAARGLFSSTWHPTKLRQIDDMRCHHVVNNASKLHVAGTLTQQLNLYSFNGKCNFNDFV